MAAQRKRCKRCQDLYQPEVGERGAYCAGCMEALTEELDRFRQDYRQRKLEERLSKGVEHHHTQVAQVFQSYRRDEDGLIESRSVCLDSDTFDWMVQELQNAGHPLDRSGRRDG